MASPQASVSWSASNKLTTYDHDPDTTGATDVSWQDMRDFGTFSAVFVRTIGTGVTSTFTILGNSESDGSGTDVTIKSHALGSEPNAIADFIFLECTAKEVQQEGEDNSQDLRYVSANITFATATDEAIVAYIFGEPRFAYLNLTADVIA